MGEPITIQISATAVAWYGAIIATVSILIGAYNAWRDRARIKVKVSYHILLKPLGNKEFAVITVINRGRRPITLNSIGSVGFALKGGKVLMSTDLEMNRFPIQITEGNSTDIHIEKEGVIKYKNGLLYAFAKDATGKVYKCKKIKDIKK